MTVIAAVADGSTVWMAADSRAAADDGRIWHGHPSQPKIARMPVGRHGGHALIGHAGTHRLGVMATRVHLGGEVDVTDQDDLNSWAQAAADAYTELAFESVPPATDGDGCLDGVWLLGYAGCLWYVTAGDAYRVGLRYSAIGSGGEFAAGALHALETIGALGEDSVHIERGLSLAVEAAIAHDSGCGGSIILERATAPPS